MRPARPNHAARIALLTEEIATLEAQIAVLPEARLSVRLAAARRERGWHQRRAASAAQRRRAVATLGRRRVESASSGA